MKKAKVLLSAFVALAMVALVACAPRGGGKKKKSTSGGSGGAVPELAWEGGFSGAVSVGASTSVVEGREAQVMPSNSATSFATLANQRIYADPDSGDTYNFTFTFEFSAKVGTEAKPATDYIESQTPSDEGKKTLLAFKGWPSQNAEQANYPRFTVKAKGTCNGESKEKTYVLVLNPLDKVFKKMSLDQLYEAADGKLTWMTGKKDTGGAVIPGAYTTDLSQTEGQSSYWIETKGILTYVAQDGNWGILQNGDKAVQVYRLDEYTGWASIRDSVMNVPIVIQAEISSGFGNIQLSYVQKIAKIEGTDSDIKPITPAEAYDEAMIKNVDWTTNTIFNKVVTKTEVKFNGKINKVKNSSGSDTVLTDMMSNRSACNSKTERYEFEVLLGTTPLIVATDYHACKDSDAFVTACDQILKSAAVGSTIAIGGSIRWMNDRSVVAKNDYSIRTAGEWTIIPFSADQVA